MYVVKKKTAPSVKLFNMWLSEKEEALRQGGACAAVGEPVRKAKSSVVKQAALLTPNSGETKYCQFCSGAHWLTECTKFAAKSPSERILWFKSEGRCFLCHKKSHRSGDCISKRRCTVPNCGARHSVLLHDVFVRKVEQTPAKTSSTQSGSDAPKPQAVGSTTRGNTPVVYLQTLPVRVHSPNGRVVETFAMMDSGSQITLVNELFAKEIGLNGPAAPLCIGNLRENEPIQKSKRVTFWLSDPKNPSMTPLKVQEAWTYNTSFNLPKQSIPHSVSNHWPHVRDLDFCDIDPSQITILIGANIKKAFVQVDIREGPEHLPLAVKTPLGWTLLGPAMEDLEICESASCSTIVHFVGHCTVQSDDKLPRKVEGFLKSDIPVSEKTSGMIISTVDQKPVTKLNAQCHCQEVEKKLNTDQVKCDNHSRLNDVVNFRKPKLCKLFALALLMLLFISTANYCLQRYVVDNTGGEFSDEALYTVKRSFYVDDMCKAVDSVTQGISLAIELIKLLGTGGFKLTKWASNSAEVLKAISELDPELNISTVVDLSLDDKDKVTQRTLGVQWNVKRDMFVFEGIEMKCVTTKRGILSAISTVFDPLGFLAPFVLRAKLILQSLWEKGLDWDEPIDEDDLREWQQWVTELQELSNVELKRCFWPAGFKTVRFVLHTFADSSERAYGAVCYLQMISDTGEIHVGIVMSKTRVAPVKRHCLTLPRLELQAAVLAVDVHDVVVRELDLPIADSYFWSDSMIVLQYIHNDKKRHETFIANRVSKIRRSTEPSQWRFVPGILNPADDCSRGLAMSQLSNNSRWFRGAEFLWLDQSMWPEQPTFESKETSMTDVISVKNVTMSDVTECSQPDSSIDPSRFSTLIRLKRVTAWCFRFLHNARNPNEKRVGKLTVEELNEAIMFWVKTSQREAFQPEIAALSSGNPLPKRSPLLQLTPVLIEGVLRIGGRLHNAKIPFGARHQAIIPRDHAIAKLLVVDAHKRLHHVGLEHTIAEIRQSYWIIRLRSMVKHVIYSCFYCRRRRVNPIVPLMATLPECRLACEQPVFTYTALDYFGPMLIKRGRGREKRWGCLFTCLSTRAVHLELVNGLGTDAFLMALRRFIARRGNPSDIFSDNGTNFVGANNELKEAIESWNADERVQNMLSERAIHWHFFSPKTPHMNGAAEALVGSTKRALKAILQERCVHEDTLHTTLCEIEAILNSRPLTYNSSDPSDFEPLTPNHFLLNRPAKVFSPVDVSDADLSSRKRWRQCQVLADHFWRRWRREYLPTLTMRSKWLCEVRNLKEGDLVQIVDNNAPRGQWSLARVLEVFPGEDGRVRVVKVKTATGVLTRPVAQLCFLEES